MKLNWKIIILLLTSIRLEGQDDKKLIFYNWGISYYSNSKCEIKIREEYGFGYIQVAGCVITSREVKKWKRHNSRINKKLKKKYGSNWKSDYQAKVDECKALSQINKIESKLLYKNISDSEIKKGDKILAPKFYYSFEGLLRIQEEYLDSIKVIMKFINLHSKSKIEIGVHTDSRGRHDYNKLISERRSDAIKIQLQKMGLISPNIIVKGYGETNPIYKDSLIEKLLSEELKDKYHNKNNRVELKVLE